MPCELQSELELPNTELRAASVGWQLAGPRPSPGTISRLELEIQKSPTPRGALPLALSVRDVRVAGAKARRVTCRPEAGGGQVPARVGPSQNFLTGSHILNKGMAGTGCAGQ